MLEMCSSSAMNDLSSHGDADGGLRADRDACAAPRAAIALDLRNWRLAGDPRKADRVFAARIAAAFAQDAVARQTSVGDRDRQVPRRREHPVENRSAAA